MQARVLANYGRQLLVLPTGGRSSFRVHAMPDGGRAVAGDLVRISDHKRLIGVEPRRSVLSRADGDSVQVIAANIDRVILVCSLTIPPFREGLVDRYRVFCTIMDLPLLLIMNKSDESFDGCILERARRFENQGVQVLTTSAREGRGLQPVAEQIDCGISVFSGHSGAGKSTLLSRFLPNEAFRIRSVNPTKQRGRHATTAVRAYPYQGGFLIDTPGIRRFGFVGIEPSDVVRAFPDVDALSEGCRFRDCKHTIEPDCAVRDAVQRGLIDGDRYEAYRRIVSSIIQNEER